MNEIIRVTPSRHNKVKTLIRKRCCNCDNGNCLLLDDGYDPCPCPQLITRSLLCKWFLNAVLPGDKPLYEEIILRKGKKFCSECGRVIIPSSNRAKYCPDCAVFVRRRKEAERQRNLYRARKGKEDGHDCTLKTKHGLVEDLL